MKNAEHRVRFQPSENELKPDVPLNPDPKFKATKSIKLNNHDDCNFQFFIDCLNFLLIIFIQIKRKKIKFMISNPLIYYDL